MLVGAEASMEGQALLFGFRKRVVAAVVTGRAVVQSGGQAVRGCRQHGHWRGATAARDRQHRAWQNGQALAESDFWRTPYLGVGTDQGARFHLARAGCRARAKSSARLAAISSRSSGATRQRFPTSSYFSERTGPLPPRKQR